MVFKKESMQQKGDSVYYTYLLHFIFLQLCLLSKLAVNQLFAQQNIPDLGTTNCIKSFWKVIVQIYSSFAVF